MYHYNIIEEALGGIPPIEYFWNNSLRQNEEILEKIFLAYRKYSNKLIELQPKSKNEIRPAFLNDYYSAGEETARNEREDSFVRRSLFYSDSVAVMDRLGMWADLADNNDNAPSSILLGDQRCPNGIADILQVIIYRDYEKLGLLHYYKFNNSYSYGYFAKQGKQAFQKIATRYKTDSNPLAVQPYWLSLAELFKSLSLLSESGDNLDLYLPDWTWPDFSLDWLFQEINRSQPSDQVSNLSINRYRDARNIQSILKLPAPDFRDFETLSPKRLADIRDQGFFAQFRDDLSEIADQFSSDHSSEDLENRNVRNALSEKFSRARESFVRNYSKRGFSWNGSIAKGAIAGGFTYGGYAALSEVGGQSFGPSVVPAAISLAAAALSEPVYNFARWFFSEKHAVEATEIHYRMFITE